MSNSHIDQLIKKRKDEAANKEISSKVRCIVKYMGKRIIDQGELSYDGWEHLTEDLFEANESSRQIGWFFQAYPFSKDFEIQYLTDIETLTVSWFGDTVYREVEGDVVTFVSGKWEDFLDEMYAMAVVREDKYLHQENIKKITKSDAFSNKFFDFLRKNWGINFNKDVS